MHPLMLKAVIDACRARIAEGDCPTTKAIPVEQLEEAIVELAAPVPARELVSEAIAKLRTFACSMHVGKCYLCNTMWSEGAPDAHTEQCLISRLKSALSTPPAADK